MGRKKQMELDAPWLDLEGKIASEVLHAPKTGGDPHGEWACAPDRVVGVNARVNLRRNNFDPLVRWLFLSTIDTLQSSLSRLLCQTADRTATPPCGRSSPPGHAVVDGWRRDERTRDILQRNPRSLVSSAKPTTGVQVVRPAALQCLNSLTPDAKRAGIEGTLSQGVRAFGLRRSRYIGEAKTHLQHLMIACALNLVRLFAWSHGQPLEQARCSRFAALVPASLAAVSK